MPKPLREQIPWQGDGSPAHSRSFCAVANCYGTHFGTNPNFATNCYSRMKILLSLDFPFIGSVKAPPRIGWRRRPARERGLNENIIMVLALASRRKALSVRLLHRRPCTVDFAVLLFPQWNYPSRDNSRAHCCASQYRPATSSGSRCRHSLSAAAASHSPLSCASIS